MGSASVPVKTIMRQIAGFRRLVCSASTRRNWSFQALISPRRVSSRSKHWSFHCCASWRSCAISSAWCVVECRGKEGKGRQVSWAVPKQVDGMSDLHHK